MTLQERLIEAMARAYYESWRGIWDGDGFENPIPAWDATDATDRHSWIVDATAAYTALRAAEAAEGWQIVPRVATEGMVRKIHRLDFTSQTDVGWEDGYAAMLAAAPSPGDAP